MCNQRLGIELALGNELQRFLAIAADNLKYYNGVLPDGEPDNIVFTNDVAWGGGYSLSMR